MFDWRNFINRPESPKSAVATSDIDPVRTIVSSRMSLSDADTTGFLVTASPGPRRRKACDPARPSESGARLRCESGRLLPSQNSANLSAISRGEGCCIEIEKNLHDRNDSWEIGDGPALPRRKCDFLIVAAARGRSLLVLQRITLTRSVARSTPFACRTFVYG
jgi:hypothetical protein